MNRPKLLSLIILILLALVSSTAVYAAPAGSVIVKTGQAFSIGDVTCGLVKKKNVPGKMVSAARFLSHAQERKNILGSAAKASGKKRKGLIAKASRLQALIKSLGDICVAGPVVAQAPTPTPTNVPTATPLPPLATATATPVPPQATATPNATSTPPNSPTPTQFFPNFPLGSPTPTRTATPTPTSTPTPTRTRTPTVTPTPTWASAPGAIPISSYWQLNGAEIFASDGQFLGIFSDSFQSSSIGNEFGSYGSSFSATSIFNKFGQYGGIISAKSPFNQSTSNPPILFLGSSARAYLTTNSSLSPRVDTYDVAYWLGRLDDAP